MLPFGVFFTAVATGVNYFIMKWQLFYRSGNAMQYGRDLGDRMVREFEFCLFLLALGIGVKEIVLELINLTPFWISTPTVCLIIFTGFNWMYSNDWWQTWMAEVVTRMMKDCCGFSMVDMRKSTSDGEPSYEIAQLKWGRTYGTENPATRANEIRERYDIIRVSQSQRNIGDDPHTPHN